MSEPIVYNATPTGRKFHSSDAFVRGVMGPVGCLHPDTLVVTEAGPVRIADLTQPTRVLSWDARTGRFRLKLASASFLKGTDYLYRVVTQHGEWQAAGHHLALCADGIYRRVESLRPGQSLLRCSSPLTGMCASPARPKSPSGVRRWFQTLVGWTGSCAASARLYGQPLPADQAAFPIPSPLAPCVPAPVGGLSSAGHTRLGLSSVHPPMLGSVPRKAGPDDAPEAHTGRRSSSPRSGSVLQRLQSLAAFFFRRQEPLPVPHSPYIASASNETILSIEKQSFKAEYWDLQVPDTNNYVTVDGAVHHNSGKSVMMVMELYRRSLLQAPYKGVRHTRWVIIRNSYRELNDTTIKTFFDWIPEDAGVFSRDSFTFHLRQTLADGSTVKAEFLFRALDTPKDVKKLLSLEVTGGFINEAREVRQEVVDLVQTRIGRYPPMRWGGPTWQGLVMDTNPPDTDSWWYKLFEVERPEGWDYFRQPSALSHLAENIENLPPHYYTRMIEGKDQDWIKSYVHGDYAFLRTGKPVYPEFNDRIHVSENALLTPSTLTDSPILLGMDFGLTPAVSFSQIISDQWRTFHEIVLDGADAERLAQLTSEYLNMVAPGHPVMGWGDPSGRNRAQSNSSTVFGVLQAAGLPIVEACESDDGLARQQALRRRLTTLTIHGEPAFLLHPSCRTLRKGLNGAYAYRRIQLPGPNRYAEKPDKSEYSHIVEATEYALLGAGEGFTQINAHKTSANVRVIRSARTRTGTHR